MYTMLYIIGNYVAQRLQYLLLMIGKTTGNYGKFARIKNGRGDITSLSFPCKFHLSLIIKEEEAVFPWQGATLHDQVD